MDQQGTGTGAGRAVLLGAHPSGVPDARRMAGVVPRHQASATQRTPPSCRGHQWGVVGLRGGSRAHALCLPLDARWPQGVAHGREDEPDGAQRPPRAGRLIRMALQVAGRHDTPALLVLDAFVALAPAVQRAASLWPRRLQHPSRPILTRAQKHYGASAPAPPPAQRSVGRPRT